MPHDAEQNAPNVWQTMPGAAPLYEIYGRWPSLHDAVIRAMEVRFARQEVAITMDYSDTTEGGDGTEVNTRLTMQWSGITEAKLRLYDGDLYGVEFLQTDGQIETRFDPYPWGMEGFINAAAVEVTAVAPAPDMSVIPKDFTVHDEINLSFA